MSADLLPDPTGAARGQGRGAGGAWFALAVLVVVTLFSFVDRQVFVLQAQPIKEQLRLTDLQLGLLQGVGIALFAAVAAYPLGWLADRTDRRRVLALCVAVWSAAVVGCAFARSFGGLFLASAMVGAGEAGLVPIVFALIPELFHSRQRVMANSTYAIATRLGVGAAIAVCGQLVNWSEAARPWLPAALQALPGWRLAFIAAALPAPLMLALITVIPLPRRRRPAAAGEPSHPAVALAPFLRAHRRSFIGFFAGIGLAVFGFASIISWVPVITMRMYGDSAAAAGNATGLATTLATVFGFAFSWWGVRRLQPRLGATLPMGVLWASTLSAAVTTAMLLATRSALQIYVLQGVQMACVMAGIMLYPTALQNLCPSALRARLVAVNGVVSIVCGAASPVVVGAVSDWLAPRPDALLLAAVGVATASLGAAALTLGWGTSTHAATVAAAEDSRP